MSPWTRVVGALVALVAAALLLKVVPPILVLLLFVGGVAYVNARFRRAAKQAPRTGAELLGLKRETDDPFGILGYPLALFGRASEAAIEELVWGTWNGLDVWVFGLSFVAPSLPGHPQQRATFACAMTRVAAELPATVSEPTTFVTRIQRAPDAPVVATGDPRFDASFNVWSADAAFVGELLTPDLRAWLLGLDGRCGVEVRGKIALVYGPKPPRPDVISILEALRALVDLVPSDVLAAHPPVEDDRAPS